MKSSFKKHDGSEIELEVILTPEEFGDYWNLEMKSALENVEIKGFRAGSAPKDLAEKAIDKEKVFEVAVNSAVKDSLEDIKTQNNWVLVDKPKVEVLEANPPQLSGKIDAGLKFKARLVLFPEVRLPDYKAITKKVLEKENKELT